MESIVQVLVLSIFPALVIFAALSDAASMTIPNWISVALIAAFIPAAFAAGLSPAEAGLCLGVGLAALAAGVALFAAGWIGGGDAKLFAAAALWLGAPGAIPFLTWTALSGGALALGLLSARRTLAFAGLSPHRPVWLERLLRPDGDIPYGIAIAAGALAAFTQSPILQGFGG